ncbi:MAG: MBL fold metallo-hydrolase [Armatimonadetes bacterium]|nr:MBL fold metallo-hydrolase [Armatimonadota bacterium]
MSERTKPIAIAAGVVALVVVVLAIVLQSLARRPASPAAAPETGPGTSTGGAGAVANRPPAGADGATAANLPAGPSPGAPRDEAPLFSIQYWGHACFLITAGSGNDRVSAVTDPYDHRFTGYAPLDLQAQFVTISHDHRDHNYRAAVRAFPGQTLTVLDAGSAVARRGKVTISHVSTYHDTRQGAERGPNTVFIVAMDGTRLVHLGDLGHILTPEQVAAIGRVDVLLVPVGGTFTIGPAEARQVVEQLNPRLVIPMHYRTGGTAPDLARVLQPVESFTVQFADVKSLNQDTETVYRSTLNNTRPVVHVLKPAGLK